MKQIHIDMMGMKIFIVFIDASACAPPAVGLVAWLIFIDSQDRSAAISGIRNSPSAGSAVEVFAKSMVQTFQLGTSPRFMPRKL